VKYTYLSGLVLSIIATAYSLNSYAKKHNEDEKLEEELDKRE